MFRVEATPVVLLPHSQVMIPILSEPYNSQIQSRSPSSFGVSPSNRNVIESSKQSMNRKKNKDPATSRIYFAELYGLLRILLSQLQGPTTTQTVTVTQVFTGKHLVKYMTSLYITNTVYHSPLISYTFERKKNNPMCRSFTIEARNDGHFLHHGLYTESSTLSNLCGNGEKINTRAFFVTTEPHHVIQRVHSA